jgi:transposase InsO family protein
VVTTMRDSRRRPAPDPVNRRFVADGPNELWVSDMTYVPMLYTGVHRSTARACATVTRPWCRAQVRMEQCSASDMGRV